MDRTILHLDLDTFFVSVERKHDSRLEKKPVMVGGTGDRGVVAACSYETRAFGVHSGMPMKTARMLCPEAIVIRGEAGIYSKESKIVSEIISETVPVFEKASIDEFYADLSGMDKFLGSYQLSKNLGERIRKESGLPISLGLSTNKIVAKVATEEAKPNNYRKVDAGMEKSFLAPMLVNKIPMVGEKTDKILQNMGIRYVKTIQEMPVQVMSQVLGKNGVVLWNRANGLDNSPIVPFHERKSISNERTFGKDTGDIKRMREMIRAMGENLAYQLRTGNKLTSCISVKIRYSDFNTFSKQAKIPYTSADHILIPHIERLFDQLHNRRMMVRLVGVNFSDLVTGNHQINMFDDSEERLNLYLAMDHIRNKYGIDDRGNSILSWATTLGIPNISSMGNPFNGDPPIIPAHRNA
ncbi:DNA polymerase IV 1 [Dyadobacter sp. CECT 9623]|jgi:DNA polymerase-4|uniref:DNA polymerase IV n=1 Tax=Dyadobacter linearis TaxID=2823330 RepID=A0ABN7RBH7_9BACT|nr:MULTISPECIES: DNA polymerase IV [unclassified Dyadobacter]MCE7058923.1 DNA polymerase IV [Dyadobacter sp. CY343]CAG5069599.1 DNA polymerase IV 1 [Dyadobacter sp. CECT 9623]